MPVLVAVGPTPQQVSAYIDALPRLIREARIRDGLTVKTQAPLVGVTAATLTRLDLPGTNSTEATIVRCLNYLSKERP